MSVVDDSTEELILGMVNTELDNSRTPKTSV